MPFIAAGYEQTRPTSLRCLGRPHRLDIQTKGNCDRAVCVSPGYTPFHDQREGLLTSRMSSKGNLQTCTGLAQGRSNFLSLGFSEAAEEFQFVGHPRQACEIVRRSLTGRLARIAIQSKVCSHCRWPNNSLRHDVSQRCSHSRTSRRWLAAHLTATLM